MEKAMLLMSGGIDSPVAAHRLKNLKLVGVHFHYVPLATEESIKKSKKLCKILNISPLYIVPFAETQKTIVENCKHKLFFIITRRIMWRVAEKLAKKENCKFLATGENLAQVASQTLTNMQIIDKSVKLPILRPLLTNDKTETINEAKLIGTYEISKGPEICAILGPKHPETSANLNEIEEQEKNLDIQGIVNELTAQAIKSY